MKTLDQRVRESVKEEVRIVASRRAWPARFREEARHLRACLPRRLVGRIEHFGSTAVPGLPAKPVIDMLVEVASLRAARTVIAPILVAQGYDYFWRPTFGDDTPPWYAFFVKRNRRGARTHHLHMVTRRPPFREHWQRLGFRDYLAAHPRAAAAYARLKLRLARAHPRDRVAYTAGKTAFIRRVMRAATAARRRGCPRKGRP